MDHYDAQEYKLQKIVKCVKTKEDIPKIKQLGYPLYYSYFILTKIQYVQPIFLSISIEKRFENSL
jgi:hypothetical protein